MATDSFYSDLNLNFIPNPITGDVTPVLDVRAVKAALMNLLRTPVGTRPFYPEYGTNIERYLFDPADALSESEVNEEVAETIRKFEPRVQLVAIESSIEDYGIDIKIEFFVKNIPGQQVLETTLTRTS